MKQKWVWLLPCEMETVKAALRECRDESAGTWGRACGDLLGRLRERERTMAHLGTVGRAPGREPPSPERERTMAHLGALLDASDEHSCSEQCPRPECVARRKGDGR